MAQVSTNILMTLSTGGTHPLVGSILEHCGWCRYTGGTGHQFAVIGGDQHLAFSYTHVGLHKQSDRW